MSLHTVQPSYGLQKPARVVKTSASEGALAAPGEGSAGDTVRLSDEGRLMSQLSTQIAQTPENVRKLSARLAGDLKNLLGQNGVDTRRDLGIAVDSRTREINVNGDRPDAQAIAALIASRPDIERQIHDIAALSRQVALAEQGADSRLVNRMALRAAQIDAVITDHAKRFNAADEPGDFSPLPDRRSVNIAQSERGIARYDAVSGAAGAAPNLSLAFDGAHIQVHANGKPWISSAQLTEK